jgi:EmrB/QacA subfamily drug resistance transporter
MTKVDGDPNYAWKVLGIVMIGTLMSALDSSIVNVSIPAIMADFGASVDDIEWVITGYMLAFATLMPLTAWLRDRVGHKMLYTMALVVFTLGSVLCGLAWNLPMLVLARVIQAIGGGALTPTGMAMITESFEPHERGKALGYWGVGAIMGPAFGPTLGGYLTKAFGWPSIFLVNLPIGILGVFFALRVLKPDRPPETEHRPFDAWGFAFLSIFLVSFLLGLSKGESKGWSSDFVVGSAITALFSFVAFLLVESLTKARIIELELLKIPTFAACSLLTATRSVALYGGMFLLPVFLQNFRGFDEVQSGLLLLPGSLLMGLLMPISGKLSDMISPRLMAFVGFVLLSISFFQYRNIDLNTSTWDLIVPTLVRGVGIALLITPLTATAMNAVPTRKAGMASSMLNILQQVGGSMGIAVLSLVLDNRQTHHLSLVGSAVNSGSEAYRSTIANLYRYLHDVGLSKLEALRAANGLLGQYIGKFAAVHAFQDAFIVGGLIVTLSVLAVFFLPNHPVARPKGGAAVHME